MEEPADVVPPHGRLSIGAVATAVAVVVVLVVTASRYGYHRDELYFVAAGHHLAWAYADQGALTPLIARAMTAIAPDSLTVLRLPSAAAAGATVLVTAAITRDLGGSARAQLVAACCCATSVVVLFTGHTLSTTTLDLLVWTVLTWLTVLAVRPGGGRVWLAVGVVPGLGLENKPLPAFLAAGVLVGIVVSGPRRLLRERWLWAGALVAVLLWLPWLLWQGRHGWPQLDVSRSIAAGGSTSSQPWWLVVPFQPLLFGPLLAPVWVAGLVRLFRAPELRGLRFLGWAWVVLAITFMATGGKPYYLAGLVPFLLAVGAIATDRWLERGRPRLRRTLLTCVVAVSAVVCATIALPLLPARDAGPVIAMNPDVGETIGWPELVRTVAGVYDHLPDRAGAVLLAQNYGEAGAIDRFGPALGLPAAYSGHNAYADWRRPSDDDAPVIVVGATPAQAARFLRGCRVAATVTNTAGVDNDEDGADVLTCSGPRRSWAEEWPAIRHLG